MRVEWRRDDILDQRQVLWRVTKGKPVRQNSGYTETGTLELGFLTAAVAGNLNLIVIQIWITVKFKFPGTAAAVKNPSPRRESPFSYTHYFPALAFLCYISSFFACDEILRAFPIYGRESEVCPPPSYTRISKCRVACDRDRPLGSRWWTTAAGGRSQEEEEEERCFPPQQAGRLGLF